MSEKKAKQRKGGSTNPAKRPQPVLTIHDADTDMLPVMNTRAMEKMMADITRLLNQYLSERFGAPFASFTGEELVNQLKQQVIDEKQVSLIEEIVKKSDVYKFSGQPVDRGTYELIYADIVAVIEREQTRLNEVKNEKTVT